MTAHLSGFAEFVTSIGYEWSHLVVDEHLLNDEGANVFRDVLLDDAGCCDELGERYYVPVLPEAPGLPDHEIIHPRQSRGFVKTVNRSKRFSSA